MFSLFKAVVYDGGDAFVINYILNVRAAKKDIQKNLETYSCELLKLEQLNNVTLDDICNYKSSDNPKDRDMIERFENMYFN